MNQLLLEGTANDLSVNFGFSISNEQYFNVHLDYSYSDVQFNLLGNIAKGWEIIEPLLVTLEQDEDGYYILSDDLFLIYGEGKTEIEAEKDYITTFIDYYQLIDAKANVGDNFSQRILKNIQKYLRPVNY